MSLLMRATAIAGVPVVSIESGEALAEIKDVLYDPDKGRLLGFTLNQRGFLRGPLKEVLPMGKVAAIGRDAVMVARPDALQEGGALATEVTESSERNVLGNAVITESGRHLGVVTDLVVDAGSGKVVGYELEPDKDLQGHGAGRLLIPIPDTLAVSGSVLLVPDSAEPFIVNDLSGFGAAVDDFRALLGAKRP